MKIKITKEQIFKYAAVAAAAVLFASALLSLLSPHELWVNGVDVSGLEKGDSIPAGSGSISYDAKDRVLSLENATLTHWYNTAAIYSEGDLTLHLEGENRILGDSFGILVHGDLTVEGEGSVTVQGGDVAVFVKGRVTVDGGADMASLGGSRGISAENGLETGPLHRVSAGSSEKSNVLTDLWSQARYVHVHAPVTVSFDGRGGTAPQAVVLPWGSPCPIIEDGVREGYYFDGWFTDSTRLEPYSPSGQLTGDMTLYAGWTRKVYISFDTWGGSEMETVDIPVGTSLAQPQPPEKIDQTFMGWYADDDLSVPYDFTDPVNYDITLYAKWEKNCDAAVLGIDVSSWQRDIDWQAVADDGIQFAIMRAGFRGYGAEGTLNEDEYFRRNVEGALAAGLDVGCYFYCQSTTPEEAVEEAEYLIGLIGDYEMTLPVFLDFEVPVNDKGEEIGRLAEKQLSGEEHAAICLAFCQRIEEEGFTAMVYAGKGHLYQDDMAGILHGAGYGVWLAHWRMQTNYSGRYEYWQYSATGSVNGISGDVDMDIRYISAPAQVQGLAAEYGEGVVSLSWSRVPGTYGYIIERYDDETKSWLEVDRVTGAGMTAYVDDDPLEMGKAHSYRVSAYLTQSGADYVGAAAETQVIVGTLPEPAQDPAALPPEGENGAGEPASESGEDAAGDENDPTLDETAENNGADAEDMEDREQ